MSAFEDAIIQRIRSLEREVERLQKWERPIVITDHGSLSGLADDDHPQYLLRTDKAADSDKLDGVDITAFKGLDSLTDPNADRVLFWDDSAGALKWLTVEGIVDTDFGKWQDWTPTVAYSGGTTDPTSFTVTARYTRIGKLGVCIITGTLERGSGNHAYIKFTPPVSIAKTTTGSCTHQLLGGFNVAPCYTQSGNFVINTGTWTSDGSLWSTWIYETS